MVKYGKQELGRSVEALDAQGLSKSGLEPNGRSPLPYWVELAEDIQPNTLGTCYGLGWSGSAITTIGPTVRAFNTTTEVMASGTKALAHPTRILSSGVVYMLCPCGATGGSGEQYPCTWCQAETTPNFFSVTIAGVQTISEYLGPGFSIVPLASQQEARDWLNAAHRVPRLGTSPCIFELTDTLATDGTNIKIRVDLLQTGVQVRADVLGGPPDFWEGLAPDTSPYVGTGQRVPAETAHSAEDTTSYVSFDGVATVDINGTFA